jgi:hypothetical protein
MIQVLKIFDLGPFLSIAKVLGFPEYQLLDARSCTVHILNAIIGYNMAVTFHFRQEKEAG